MDDLRGAHPALMRKGIFRGIDLNALATRFWCLDAMRSDERASTPKIKWRVRSRGAYVTGRAFTGTNDVTMTISEASSIEAVAEVLLHELVHCSCPVDEHHGELFCRRLIATAREAFGLDLNTTELLALPPGPRRKRAYAIDDEITKAMKIFEVGEKLRAQEPFTPPPPVVETVAAPPPPAPPVETEAQIAARKAAQRAAMVAERERHARAKLAQWEKRLAAAKRLAGKWRTTVRYYERRQEAAKRGDK